MVSLSLRVQYGNAENFLGDAGDGTMEAISITDDTGGTMHGGNHGIGPGPWIWGDLEQGLFTGNEKGVAPSLRDGNNATYAFVTAMIKGESATSATPLGHWAIKGVRFEVHFEAGNRSNIELKIDLK